MLYLGLIVSFVVPFVIGLRKKSFVLLIVDVVLGIGFGALSVYLYLWLTPPVEAGLGIIALLPVLFILFMALNAIAAFIGGLIGTLIGRKRK